MSKGSLTVRQYRFVDSYLRHGNATVAAVEAGYSRDRARQAADELLKNPAVRAEIEKRQTKPSLAAVVKSSKDITPEYFDGTILRIIEEIEKHGLGSWQITGLAKFVEMLGRRKGFFQEKIEVDLGENIMQALLEGRQRARLEAKEAEELDERGPE